MKVRGGNSWVERKTNNGMKGGGRRSKRGRENWIAEIGMEARESSGTGRGWHNGWSVQEGGRDGRVECEGDKIGNARQWEGGR